MPEFRDLEQIRTALVSAVALVDRLTDRRSQPIDRAIVGLLGDQPDGLSTASIRSLVRRRRVDTVAAIRLLAAAGRIRRPDRDRWVLGNDLEDQDGCPAPTAGDT